MDCGLLSPLKKSGMSEPYRTFYTYLGCRSRLCSLYACHQQTNTLFCGVPIPDHAHAFALIDHGDLITQLQNLIQLCGVEYESEIYLPRLWDTLGL